MGKQERKTERTRQLRATAPDGSEVTIDERTAFVRAQYSDGWSNWTPDTRTFWLGMEKLSVLDPCTMRDRRGAVLTLAPPGIG